MDEHGVRHNPWGRLKLFVALVAVAFAVALAVMISNRLSDESLAVLAGAVCGVGAAIPTSLLVVAIARRREEPRAQPTVPQGMYPPVVVVAPPAAQPWSDGWNPALSSLRAPIQRQFTVVGGTLDGEDGE
jgi:hypothetical protein